MSTVLSTMANALIEFILSLLRDPDAAAAFDEEPDAALASAGLSNATYADVCSVMPLIYDNPQVFQRPDAVHGASPAQFVPQQPMHPAPMQLTSAQPDVVSELRDVIHNNSYVTNNNATMVDQSVNQNIWAEGDVMQLFDNEAVIASGANSVAAGNDIVDDRSHNSSTTIVAGRDAAVGNTTDVTTVVGSHNGSLDQSVTTGAPAPAPLPPADAVAPAAAAEPVAPAPASAPEPAADVLSEPEPYADQGVNAAPEPAGFDDQLTDDDY